MNIDRLMDDGYDGEPAKRVLQYVQNHKKEGSPIVGIYCGYAPIELIQSMGIVQAVIAETTCDGKKKMFELAAEVKPMHVMDLPQLPDEEEALHNWKVMIRKLQGFLERTFGRKASEQEIEASIQKSNVKNRMMRKVFDYAAIKPPVINWQEMYDVGFLALPATADEMVPILERVLEKLERWVAEGFHYGKPDSPRVLVTGCPVGGDATKVFKLTEAAGGVVVAPDACTGMKAFTGDFKENTGDPVGA